LTFFRRFLHRYHRWVNACENIVVVKYRLYNQAILRRRRLFKRRVLSPQGDLTLRRDAMPKKFHTFPNALETIFLVVGLFGLEYLMGGALNDWRQTLDLNDEEISVLATVLGNGAMFTIVMHLKGMKYGDLFHSSKHSTWRAVSLTPFVAMLVPALLLGMSSLSYVVQTIFPESPQEEAMFRQMGAANFAAVTAACVLAPVLEEMLFRGIILRSFLLQYPRWTAIVISATLFGVAHMNLYQYIVATILGIVAGWLYERSQSLIPCIVLHACYNSAVTLADSTMASDDSGLFGMYAPSTWFGALGLAICGAHQIYSRLGSRAAPDVLRP
jgi:membrane protease YdiL (CAAX protease family)